MSSFEVFLFLLSKTIPINSQKVTADFKMSYVAKDKDVDASAPAAKIHKIRITLTSKNVKNLEKGE